MIRSSAVDVGFGWNSEYKKLTIRFDGIFIFFLFLFFLWLRLCFLLFLVLINHMAGIFQFYKLFLQVRTSSIELNTLHDLTPAESYFLSFSGQYIMSPSLTAFRQN